MERQVLPAPVKVQIKGPNLGAKGFCQSDGGLVYPFSPNRYTAQVGRLGQKGQGQLGGFGPAEGQRVVRGRQNGAGGMFYHTRITSKRIE